ncbi:MAG: cytochrome C oxidase subunit IV family protein [Candidatus Sumerlaeia bacterium]
MSEHIVEPRIYVRVFAALMALLALTIGVSALDLGLFNWVAALTIAVVKASLVTLYFMHARYGSHQVWLVAGMGIVWFLIMVVLTLSDYVARGVIARP